MIGLILLGGPFPAGAATEWFVAAGGTGDGLQEPFGGIQQALEAAQPGDVVTVREGQYDGPLVTVRHGEAEAPIRVRSEGGRGSVLVTARGRVLTVLHAHFIVDGLVLDGQYGPSDTVVVRGPASGLVIRDTEIRRSSRDLLDIGDQHDVLIENCLIHHALNASGGRTDAHGIAAGAVRNLTIRNTEIHTFSGDGIQVDPGRSTPGWSDVVIEGSRIWLAPLPTAESGFAVGTVPGENALDTKANGRLPRATITIRDTEASGFRDGLLANMAAFNLKENIDATVERVTVFDSEIAFRLRGPAGGAEGGAWVTIRNAEVRSVLTAFRYENDIEQLRIRDSTIGQGVTRVFQAASSSDAGLDVQNLVTSDSASPGER